jgi:hypothetical protein
MLPRRVVSRRSRLSARWRRAARFCAAWPAHPTGVFVARHVEHPMALVLDAPVVPDDTREGGRVERLAEQELADLDAALFADPALRLDQPDAAQARPSPRLVEVSEERRVADDPGAAEFLAARGPSPPRWRRCGARGRGPRSRWRAPRRSSPARRRAASGGCPSAPAPSRRPAPRSVGRSRPGSPSRRSWPCSPGARGAAGGGGWRRSRWPWCPPRPGRGRGRWRRPRR